MKVASLKGKIRGSHDSDDVKSDTQSPLLLPVAAASSETGISSLPSVSHGTWPSVETNIAKFVRHFMRYTVAEARGK